MRKKRKIPDNEENMQTFLNVTYLRRMRNAFDKIHGFKKVEWPMGQRRPVQRIS